jgi:hypothetical protein
MKKSNWKLRLGIALVILTVVLFSFLFIIPFLKIDGKVKIKLTTVAIVAQKISLWSGILLIGKELYVKYKSYINPKNWFKKN